MGGWPGPVLSAARLLPALPASPRVCLPHREVPRLIGVRGCQRPSKARALAALWATGPRVLQHSRHGGPVVPRCHFGSPGFGTPAGLPFPLWPFPPLLRLFLVGNVAISTQTPGGSLAPSSALRLWLEGGSVLFQKPNGSPGSLGREECAALLFSLYPPSPPMKQPSGKIRTSNKNDGPHCASIPRHALGWILHLEGTRSPEKFSKFVKDQRC